VRDAVSRLKKRLPRSSTRCPDAVVLILRGGSTSEAYDLAEQQGVHVQPRRKSGPKADPAKAKRQSGHPDCEHCGAPRKNVRRVPAHPLYPFCYDCVRFADRRLRHRVPNVATRSPRAVAHYLRHKDREAALRLAVQDGCQVKGRIVLSLDSDEPTKAAHTAPPTGQPAQLAGFAADGAAASCLAAAPSAAISSPAAADESLSAGPGGESLRRPCAPSQAFPAELGQASAADTLRASADPSDQPGVQGPAIAQSLLARLRESAVQQLVEVTRLEAENRRLKEENGHLVRALAASKGLQVDR